MVVIRDSSAWSSMTGYSRLLIPSATLDVVLGRNNNFPKSDEIGPQGQWNGETWDGRVTAFIGCFKAISMRDTLSLNNAREPIHPPPPLVHPPTLQDFSIASLSLSLSLFLPHILHTLAGLVVDVAVCVRQKLLHEIRRNGPRPICGQKPFRFGEGRLHRCPAEIPR